MAEQEALLSPPASLTPYEACAMRIIQEIMDKEGHPPTLQELANDLGHSTRSAGHRVVKILVEKGWLRRLPGRWRFSIQIVHRVPEPEELATMDVRAVAAIAVDAIHELKMMMGGYEPALKLAARLDVALKGAGGGRTDLRADGEGFGGAP